MKTAEQHTGTKMFAHAMMEGRVKASKPKPMPQKKPAAKPTRGK